MHEWLLKSAGSSTGAAVPACWCQRCSARCLVPSCSPAVSLSHPFVQLYSRYAPYEYKAYWFEIWQSYEALIGCRSVSYTAASSVQQLVAAMLLLSHLCLCAALTWQTPASMASAQVSGCCQELACICGQLCAP